jgi:predicted SAM-dependent methyltransferase
MSHFIKLKNNDKLCPKCGSLARTRKLWNILEHKIQGKKILHFSPSASIREKIESLNNSNYVTSDLVGEFKASKRLNIESIDELNDSYDLVICYHILEHIEDDIKAMKELLRIIKPKGKCIIQTPFKTGEIYENNKVKTDEERLIHFGQKDHVRIYSSEGLMKRLESVGFKSKMLEFKNVGDNKYGFNLNEKIIIAEKIGSNTIGKGNFHN